jgi:hypothetical protein
MNPTIHITSYNKGGHLFVILLVSAMLLVVGCMFGDLKKEVQEEKTTYSLFGRVEGISQSQYW